MGLIKFILISVLVMYIIRIILRLIFPVVLRSMFSKVQQQAANQSRQPNNQRYSKPEGDISIEYVPPREKKGNSDKLGDFVDYEEIK
ncbi:DUF4834 family protein [Pedobacter panaciterrae]|uniref:DUF4834 family protein n=1 Tax=Pedobacter panaciterrae TaxID=363849 RepID=A0ABU8NQ28_9SPHI|nr:DUF4834 family protein [Pedobacter panaciterrae]NQX55301.1 DUF4834 family protein [Pedobacter panaciterrae]